MTYRIVWFKRDLRLQDHAALAHAAAQGPVMCLYMVEPELWAQADAALQHFEFVRESLAELHHALQLRGGSLQVRLGNAVQVLAALHAQAPFAELVAHQETGNAFTFERDLQVGAWCRHPGVAWTELPQFGVVRRLQSRNTWQAHWEAHMTAPQAPLPALHFFTPHENHGPEAMSPPPGLWHNPAQRQRGGRRLDLETLHSFLDVRAMAYRGGISSPLTSPTACSRLSAYLAWGCISMRGGATHPIGTGATAATSGSPPCWPEWLCQPFVLALPLHSKARKRARNRVAQHASRL